MSENQSNQGNKYTNNFIESCAKNFIESCEMKLGGVSCRKQVYCKHCDEFHDEKIYGDICKICKFHHEKQESCIVALMKHDMYMHMQKQIYYTI